MSCLLAAPSFFGTVDGVFFCVCRLFGVLVCIYVCSDCGL